MSESRQRPGRTALYVCALSGIVLAILGAGVLNAAGAAAPAAGAALLSIASVLLLVAVIAIGVEIGVRNARPPDEGNG